MYAILVDKKVVPCELESWAKWYEKGNRRVAEDTVNGQYVSTVFLGIDHGFTTGQPRWFETMVFGGDNEDYQRRYATWDEAVEGHNDVVATLKAGRMLP